MNEWMNEYDLSDAITETVAWALNKIKFQDGVECQRGNDAANRWVKDLDDDNDGDDDDDDDE